MDELKSHIGLALRSSEVHLDELRQLSVTGLSFIEDHPDGNQTPCWLCIVNICALEALNDPDSKLISCQIGWFILPLRVSVFHRSRRKTF